MKLYKNNQIILHENTVYCGYWEAWQSNTRYQFDAYQGDEDEVLILPQSTDRNIDLTFVPIYVVQVDIAHSPRGWRVCQHQPRIEPTESPTPITYFMQFAQSQSAYISQYYIEIICEILVIAIYNQM